MCFRTPCTYLTPNLMYLPAGVLFWKSPEHYGERNEVENSSRENVRGMIASSFQLGLYFFSRFTHHITWHVMIWHNITLHRMISHDIKQFHIRILSSHILYPTIPFSFLLFLFSLTLFSSLQFSSILFRPFLSCQVISHHNTPHTITLHITNTSRHDEITYFKIGEIGPG